MASITLPTSVSIPGPWLLTPQNLTELDSVIDSCFESMQKQRQRTIENILASQQNEQKIKGRPIEDEYPLNINHRAVTVYLGGGRTADGVRFSDLTTLAHIQDEKPRGFRLKAALAKSSVEIQLNSWDNKELTVDVKSDDNDFAQELLGRIQNWSSELQSRKWLHVWNNLAFFAFFFIILILTINICAVVYARTSETLYGPSTTLQQARELVRQGVTSVNEAKAVELLLSLQTGTYSTPAIIVRHHVNSWIWMLLILLDFLGVAASFPPRGAIGLWAGRRSVDAQKRWIRIVTITIPGLLLTTVFMPLVRHWLGY